MKQSNFYVTPKEFMEHLEVALRDTYFRGDEWDKRKWHPEDIAANTTVVIDSIAAYLGSAVRMEAQKERGELLPPPVKYNRYGPETGYVEGKPE